MIGPACPMVVPQGPPAAEAPATEAVTAAECEVEIVHALGHRISWARLLKRVFNIAMQHCPNCGSGELKINVAILERPVIEGRIIFRSVTVRASDAYHGTARSPSAT